jgi:hypothetical protein
VTWFAILCRKIRDMKWTSLLLLVFAVAQLAFHGTMIAKGEEWITSGMTIDDTYYYLEPAWNMAHSGMVTFDGEHRTNGVQFLWFWIVTAMALIATSKTVLLTLTMTLCAVLSAACYVPINKMSSKLGHPMISVICGICWLNINLHVDANSGSYVMGLENSLMALLLWTSLYVFGENLLNGDATRRGVFLMALLLALITLTRVDAVVISICFASLLLVQRQKGRAERMLIILGCISVSVVGMAVIYHWMGGSPVPVSALVKSGWPRWDLGFYFDVYNRQPGAFFEVGTRNFGDALIIGPFDVLNGVNRLFSKLLGIPFMDINKVYVAWTLTMMMSLFVTVGLARNRTQKCLVYPWAALGVGSWVLFVLYGQYPFYWYLSGLTIWFIFGLALACDGFVEWISLWNWKIAPGAQRTAFGVSVAVLICCVLVVQARHAGFILSRQPQTGLYQERYHMCKWLRETLPSGVRLASYSSGQIAFFSGFPTLNLDGLMNDYDFYRSVVRDRTLSMSEYLDREAVDYVIDYNLPEEILAKGEVVRVWYGTANRILKIVKLNGTVAPDKAGESIDHE